MEKKGELEIVLNHQPGEFPPPGPEVESNRDMIVSIKSALMSKGITSDFLVEKIAKLLDAKTITQSGIEYDDNAIILKTIELVLKLGGIRGIGNGPTIAIFNNAPGKDDKLKY